METSTTPAAQSNFGKELLSAFIIVVIALGAGYMIYKKSSQPAPAPVNNVSADPVVNTISTQSDSDEVGAIEADVNATDFSTIGQ